MILIEIKIPLSQLKQKGVINVPLNQIDDLSKVDLTNQSVKINFTLNDLSNEELKQMQLAIARQLDINHQREQTSKRDKGTEAIYKRIKLQEKIMHDITNNLAQYHTSVFEDKDSNLIDFEIIRGLLITIKFRQLDKDTDLNQTIDKIMQENKTEYPNLQLTKQMVTNIANKDFQPLNIIDNCNSYYSNDDYPSRAYLKYNNHKILIKKNKIIQLNNIFFNLSLFKIMRRAAIKYYLTTMSYAIRNFHIPNFKINYQLCSHFLINKFKLNNKQAKLLDANTVELMIKKPFNNKIYKVFCVK